MTLRVCVIGYKELNILEAESIVVAPLHKKPRLCSPGGVTYQYFAAFSILRHFWSHWCELCPKYIGMIYSQSFVTTAQL